MQHSHFHQAQCMQAQAAFGRRGLNAIGRSITGGAHQKCTRPELLEWCATQVICQTGRCHSSSKGSRLQYGCELLLSHRSGNVVASSELSTHTALCVGPYLLLLVASESGGSTDISILTPTAVNRLYGTHLSSRPRSVLDITALQARSCTLL
jgi:hypothetical protein